MAKSIDVQATRLEDATGHLVALDGSDALQRIALQALQGAATKLAAARRKDSVGPLAPLSATAVRALIASRVSAVASDVAAAAGE